MRMQWFRRITLAVILLICCYELSKGIAIHIRIVRDERKKAELDRIVKERDEAFKRVQKQTEDINKHFEEEIQKLQGER